MAPALTHTAEPSLLADAACHSPSSDSNIIHHHTFSPYDHHPPPSLKEELNHCSRFEINKSFFESGHVILTNGDDCESNGVAPPASGWAEGSPTSHFSSPHSNMDKLSPLPASDCGSDSVIPSLVLDSHANPPILKMGLTSCIKNVTAAVADDNQGSCSPVPSSQVGQTNDLLALVGRDFDNVSDIIDTLQRLASNPELLDVATAGELEDTPIQAPPAAPEARAPQLLGRLSDRQRLLERRRLFLLRRLRRVNAKTLCTTVSGFLGDAASHVQQHVEEERAKAAATSAATQPVVGLEMLREESMKSMSTSDLISLVRRVEASAQSQRRSAETFSPLKRGDVESVRSLPAPLCAELDAVAAEMRGAAVLAHSSYDSDATESSSGGESCDEDQSGFNDFNTDCNPIRERAFYKYCRMRGLVASKWTWLHAQIANIDYKISHQQKILSNLRRTKGSVRLAEEQNKPLSTRNPAHLDMQDPALTCLGSVNSRTILNGCHTPSRVDEMASSPVHTGGGAASWPLPDGGCSRTIGTEKVKRRRYVRPSMSFLSRSGVGTGTHSGAGKSVYRLSSAQCKCVPPLNCILCVKNRTKSLLNFGNQLVNSSRVRAHGFANSKSTKLARVDQGFHSILSPPAEMLQGEYFSSSLKNWDWPRKSLVTQPASSDCLSMELPPSNVSGASHSDLAERDRLQPAAKKSRKEREHKRNGRRKSCKEDLIKEANAASTASILKRSGDSVDETDEEVAFWQASASGSACSSPCPSPAFVDRHHGKGNHVDAKSNRKYPTATRQKQNSTSNSYDINNIVIPFKLAASSRVEPLQYKEILTPEWRVQELLPLDLSSSELGEIEDDISEELMIARHGRSEETERKKFLKYWKSQIKSSSRFSRSRRADSSGTNTPDQPLSPRVSEPIENSPVNSPLEPCMTDPSEDSSNQSTSATVLSLSLSSLSKSVASCAEVKSSNQPSSAAPGDSDLPINGVPAPFKTRLSSVGPSYGLQSVKTRRFTTEKQRTELEEEDNDRVSPFPCRQFPLDEVDYEDLFVDENSAMESRLPDFEKSGEPVGSAVYEMEREDKSANSSILTRTALESGQNTPLSELTDSAPEEDSTGVVWDDKETPDWTISALNDSSGGFVLAVQKN